MIHEDEVEIAHWVPYLDRIASRAYCIIGSERSKVAVDVDSVPPDPDDVMRKMNAGEFRWL